VVELTHTVKLGALKMLTGIKGMDKQKIEHSGMFVSPARSSPTTTQMRRMVWFYAVTGPTPVRAAPSNRVAPTGKERRITRWEHEHVLEAVQKRLDRNPQAMRQRRETAEHPLAR
jgi:hypothetical protein